MPRISFNYKSSNEWYEKTGEGTSTFDVCNRCFKLDSKTLLKQVGGPYQGEPSPSSEEEVSHDDICVGNPSLYEGEEVLCDCCNRKLIINHNY